MMTDEELENVTPPMGAAMRTVETVQQARACVLDLVSRQRQSAGNVTRKMMGMGLLPNKPESYALVAEALRSLLADDLITKAGNGKAVHWALKVTGSQRSVP